VEGVAAAFDGGADDTAHEIAEFGGGVVRDEVEFLDRIRAGGVADQIVRYLIERAVSAFPMVLN
jgi:hypothetical protein